MIKISIPTSGWINIKRANNVLSLIKNTEKKENLLLNDIFDYLDCKETTQEFDIIKCDNRSPFVYY